MAVFPWRVDPRVTLLVLLAGLAVSLVEVAGWTTTTPHAALSTPSLSAAQKRAAMSALERVTPPASFRRYERWSVGSSPHSPATACLPQPSVCFGSTVPPAAVTRASARTLLARFGLHTSALDCPSEVAPPPLAMCFGSGKLSGQKVQAILTAVRPGAGQVRAGTEVVLFAR